MNRVKVGDIVGIIRREGIEIPTLVLFEVDDILKEESGELIVVPAPGSCAEYQQFNPFCSSSPWTTKVSMGPVSIKKLVSPNILTIKEYKKLHLI